MPLLSEISPNYLTVENETLISFLPFPLLLSGRAWVESQEGSFPFNSASVQCTQLTPKRTCFLGRGAGSSTTQISERTPVALASSTFCSVSLCVVFRNSPPCNPPLVEDHKLRCLPCMPFVCVFCFCSLTAEPQPVWVLGANVIPEEASPPGKLDSHRGN